MRIRLLVFLTILVLASSLAFGGTIVTGFASTSDGRNDDGTYTTGGCNNPFDGGTCAGSLVSIGFTGNLYGTTFSNLYINTNGNLTLLSPLSIFTPFDLTTTNRFIIAPFFADVDTRNTGSAVVAFGTGMFGGHNAFGATWNGVGYYGNHVDKLNYFQVVLVDRGDIGAGDMDIYFNYDGIGWDTGDASGGAGGTCSSGGTSATVGFSNGTTTSLQLAGSSVCGAFLDGGSNALVSHSNVGVAGRYLFTVRNGNVDTEPPEEVPEPAGLLLAASGLAAVAARWRKH